MLRPSPNCVLVPSAPHHSVIVDGAPRCLCAKRLSPAELAYLRLRHRSPFWSGSFSGACLFPLGWSRALQGGRGLGSVGM